jgi:hypothetical protein
MSPWWKRSKPKEAAAPSVSRSTIVNLKASSASESISSYATQESSTTAEKPSIIPDADTLSSPSPSPQAKETTQLGWKILDKLILFLNIANQVLSGVPFQGAVAAPLELLRSFQASILSSRYVFWTDRPAP